MRDGERASERPVAVSAQLFVDGEIDLENGG